jgi:hypothetical protein
VYSIKEQKIDKKNATIESESSTTAINEFLQKRYALQEPQTGLIEHGFWILKFIYSILTYHLLFRQKSD